MKKTRQDVRNLRREQIVEAAVAAIAERGFQNLSLSEIERRAGMSRGQLTYYFPTKEEILLAVFDRLLALTYQRIGTPPGGDGARARDWIDHLMQRLVARPGPDPAFHALQHTFLAQTSHRPDFRRRLASLYEEWRGNLARGLAYELDPGAGASPRAVATVVQALLHGLAVQAAADPAAFDPGEVLDLCRAMLRSYFKPDGTPPPAGSPKKPARNGNGRGPARPRPVRPRAHT